MPKPAESRGGGAGVLEPGRGEGAAGPVAEAAANRFRRLTGGRIALRLEVAEAEAANWRPSIADDESYELRVSGERAAVTAKSTAGSLRGLATLQQLAENASGPLPAIEIRDQPRFPWRGFMLDVARRIFSVEAIKRNLELMAAVKLNVFHWHLTDDQGFRIESRRFPKLHQRGSGGFYYSQDQVREIVEFARQRGIRVVPEFDVPGHATAWLAGYPELGSAPGPYETAKTWGIHDPCFDPSNPKVYEFLEGFFREMASLFPDPYVHIGGDEVSGRHWKANARVQAWARAEGVSGTHAIQTRFLQKVQQIVARSGKKMIGWDEIANDSLPRDTVIHAWRPQYSIASALGQGFPGLYSTGFYLDRLLPASSYFAADPAKGVNPNAVSRLLGGEACLWVEFTSEETLDAKIWPRLAVIAERLWSPSGGDEKEMYGRLASVSQFLARLGSQHESRPRQLREKMASDPAALEELVAYLRPMRGFDRMDVRIYRTDSTLTRLVDTIPSDSTPSRELIALLRAVAANPSDRESAAQAEATLERLAKLRARLTKGTPNPEVLSAARQVEAAAVAGLEAIRALRDGRKLNPSAEIRSLERGSAVAPGAEAQRDCTARARLLIELGFFKQGAESRCQTAHPPEEVTVTLVPAVVELLRAASR